MTGIFLCETHRDSAMAYRKYSPEPHISPGLPDHLTPIVSIFESNAVFLAVLSNTSHDIVCLSSSSLTVERSSFKPVPLDQPKNRVPLAGSVGNASLHAQTGEDDYGLVLREQDGVCLGQGRRAPGLSDGYCKDHLRKAARCADGHKFYVSLPMWGLKTKLVWLSALYSLTKV